MSKQDIEKRLGFAAQGVKSEFGSNDPYMQERTVKTRKGKTTDLVAQIAQNGGGGDYIATLMIVHSDGEGQVLQSKYGYKTPESATRAAIRLFDAHVSRGGYARSGSKANMAAPKGVGRLAVTDSEYAALVASDAAGLRISSNSQYQITSQDRAIIAAGKQATKSALARHDAYDKAWRNAPNDAARARVEAEAEKAESGMKKYVIKRYNFARPGVTVGAPDIAYVRGVGQDYGRRASEKGIARLIDDKEALARIRLLKYGVDAMSPLRSKIDKAFDEGWLKGLTQEKIQRAENPTKFKVGDQVSYSIGTSTHVGTVARVLASAKPEPEYLVNFTTLPTGSPRRNVSESSLRKTSASRSGVKAKMGSSQVNDSATTADLIREAQRLRDVIKTSNREFDKTHLRQIKQELDRRGVLMPYGASEVLAARPAAKAKA